MGVTSLRDSIIAALSNVHDPDTGRDIVSAGMVDGFQEDGKGNIIFLLKVASSRGAALEPLRQEAERAALGVVGVKKAVVVLTAEKSVDKMGKNIADPSPNRGGNAKSFLSRIGLGGQKEMRSSHASGNSEAVVQGGRGFDPHKMAKNPVLDFPAKNIIVVVSGKGGVGKSTVAANMAAYLANFAQKEKGGFEGENGQNFRFRVGLLDADIYGPSQPTLMGEVGYKPALDSHKKMIPLTRHNMKIMSIGFLVDQDKALVWRGPMAQTAFYQLLRDVAWTEVDPQTGEEEQLDCLIIDMPPGTGDIQLTLAQKLRVSGAVIVSTPQDIALIDARRAVEMFHKTNVPIIGIVENMSFYVCEHCGHEAHIFGSRGAEEEAKKLGVPFLGRIPLSAPIRVQSDAGTPIVLSTPDSPEAKAFAEVAEAITRAVKA